MTPKFSHENISIIWADRVVSTEYNSTPHNSTRPQLDTLKFDTPQLYTCLHGRKV